MRKYEDILADLRARQAEKTTGKPAPDEPTELTKPDPKEVPSVLSVSQVGLSPAKNSMPTPREHFFSLADGHEGQGIVGRLGAVVTGELWQAVQHWEKAAERSHPRAAELESAYWESWRRHFPGGL